MGFALEQLTGELYQKPGKESGCESGCVKPLRIMEEGTKWNISELGHSQNDRNCPQN